jgi:hypothetical protein
MKAARRTGGLKSSSTPPGNSGIKSIHILEDRNVNRRLIGLLIVPCLAGALSAQPRFQGGLNFAVGFPQGEFKQNTNADGYGLSGQFAYRLPETSFWIGANLGFLIYGSDTHEINYPGAPVWVDVTTTNSILMGHLMFRIQSPEGSIRPYIDGLIGFNYLWTETKLQNQDNDEDNEIASSTNFDDSAWSYGAGAGIFFQVYSPPENEDGTRPLDGVFVDVGIRYLRGTEAKYLIEGSITNFGNEWQYDVKKSVTDIVVAHLGVAVTF